MRSWLVALGLLVASLAPAQKAKTVDNVDPKKAVKFTIVQLNDVYEIAPVGGEGGMAKVATVLNKYKAADPNSFLVLAGDFFSPSALGTARVNGERLAGQQMVAVLNQIPLSLATFGNHEFDLNEALFHKRLAESKFEWVSGNCFDAAGNPFENVAPYRIRTITGPQGSVKVGFFGVTIPSTPAKYVSYTDFMAAAEKAVRELRPQVDVLIAVTHLAFEDDIRLAQRFPEVDMIIGGHEHEHHRIEIASLAGIYKADANARTLYIHQFAFDPSQRQLAKKSFVERLSKDVREDPRVKTEVDKWVKIAFDAFRKDGFEPTKVVANVPISLDGSEASVRKKPTELTKIIASGMLAAVPGMDLAIYNGGSVRIDDVLAPGILTEYDVIRILPFGGKIVSVEMKGSLLQTVLDQGVKNAGTGGYLQTANVERSDSGWTVNGAAIDPGKAYRVAISDFLLTGAETGLPYLKRDHPDLKVIAEHADIRTATIEELKRRYPMR